MNLPRWHVGRRLRRTPAFFRISGCLFLLLLAACFGGGEANQENAADGQPAPLAQPLQMRLACSEACATNGQCGRANDGRIFILARSDQPNTQGHDRLLPAEALVEILGSEQRTIQQPGRELAQQTFSFVNVVEEQKTGWVADWCFVNP